MVTLSTFLVVTALAHSVLASAVLLHSRLTGRDPGYWLPLTLVFGLGGVAGYLFRR